MKRRIGGLAGLQQFEVRGLEQWYKSSYLSFLGTVAPHIVVYSVQK